MKIVRTIWLLAIGIAFWPIITLVGIIWFVWCIWAAKQLSETVMYGVKMWCQAIRAGIEMNKDFVKNGLFGT